MSIQNVTAGVSGDFRASANRFFLPGAGDFAQTLNLGQIIKGKVMRQFEGGNRYLVNFEGHERVVDSGIPLTTGELIHGRVIALGDRVEMQRIRSGEETPRTEEMDELTMADRLAGLDRHKRLLDDLTARFRVQLDASDKSTLLQATRLAGDADAMTLVGVMINKLGLRQAPDLLWPVYRALVRENSASASLNSDENIPQLVITASTQSGLQASTIRQLADLLIKQVEQHTERKETENTASAPKSLTDPNASVATAITPAMSQQNQNDGNGADPRQLAHRLLNVQNGGTVAHRIGTVPLLLGDQLIEVDLSFFEQNKERSVAPGAKHRKVVFSLQMENLGSVDITATMSGTHVRLQIATNDKDSTAAASTHAEELREALAAGGWEIDEIAYETRQVGSQNGVVRSVVDHIVSQDSLNRLI